MLVAIDPPVDRKISYEVSFELPGGRTHNVVLSNLKCFPGRWMDPNPVPVLPLLGVGVHSRTTTPLRARTASPCIFDEESVDTVNEPSQEEEIATTDVPTEVTPLTDFASFTNDEEDVVEEEPVQSPPAATVVADNLS